jgi:hypothetical protein
VTERVIVPRVSRVVQWVLGAAVSVAAAAAHAQSFDAGKSPAQIFSDTCNDCHRSPRELKQTTPGFMQEHYTTSGREAAAMAVYLAKVGSDPRAVQQRRPPALGASQAPPTETKPPQSPPQGTDQAAIRPPKTIPPDTDQAKLPETQEALPATTPARRTPAAAEHAKPSEEAKPSQGAITAAALKPRRPSESLEAGKLPEGATPQPAEAPSPKQNSLEDFEE